jgi:hypothetical protein
MIEEKILPAHQVVPCGPWQIPMEALDTEAIRKEATHIKNRVRVPQSQRIEGQQSMLVGIPLAQGATICSNSERPNHKLLGLLE